AYDGRGLRVLGLPVKPGSVSTAPPPERWLPDMVPLPTEEERDAWVRNVVNLAVSEGLSSGAGASATSASTTTGSVRDQVDDVVDSLSQDASSSIPTMINNSATITPTTSIPLASLLPVIKALAAQTGILIPSVDLSYISTVADLERILKEHVSKLA